MSSVSNAADRVNRLLNATVTLSTVDFANDSKMKSNAAAITSPNQTRASSLPKGATAHLDWALLIQRISAMTSQQMTKLSSIWDAELSSELGDKLISSLKQESSSRRSPTMHEDDSSPLDSLDWRRKAGLYQLGFIENTETDTQVCICLNSQCS